MNLSVAQRGRLLAAGVLTSLIAAFAPAPASAVTTVQRSGDTVTITGDGAANEIDVTSNFDRFDKGALLIGDNKADAIQIGPGCTPAQENDANFAVCGSARDVGLISVTLGAGNDRFFLGEVTPDLNPAYRSLVRGGPGRDTLDGWTGRDVLRGDGGRDSLHGKDGNDRLFGGGGNDLLFEGGGIGDDEKGNDLYSGGGGRDSVFASGAPGGRDRFSGGAGFDTMGYGGRFARVVVKLDRRANDGSKGEHDKVSADFEKIVGGNGNDLLKGGRGRTDLAGMGGDDKLISRNGRGGDRVTCDFPVDSGNDIAIIDRGDSVRRGFCDRVVRR